MLAKFEGFKDQRFNDLHKNISVGRFTVLKTRTFNIFIVIIFIEVREICYMRKGRAVYVYIFFSHKT